MKRQCDSQSGDHDPTPAAKLANIAASTATTSPSNDNDLRDHLHSFGLLPTHANTADASNAYASDTGAKEGATPTPPDLAEQNVHPYYLLQLHPLWPDALKALKRADYDAGTMVISSVGEYFLKSEPLSALTFANLCSF